MYSKRQLYKPAPKQNVGQKKVRKLVQGTLVSTNNFANPDQGPSSNNNNVNSHSLRPTQNNDVLMARSVSSDIQDDPSMSPCRSVPALTEFASPRAEPPSRCLDLSDTELNLSIASSTSTAKRQQPIMVCDASHLGSSPDNTEVEVVVDYEDSPARVICHTPSHSISSPRNVTASTGRRGPISLVFDSPRASGLGASNSDGGSGRDFVALEDENKKLAVENKETRSLFISEHSRGIIKEILAEEIGSRDCSSLSLYSHESSPRSSDLPRSSSPVVMSKHYTSPMSKNSKLSLFRDNVPLNKTPTKSREITNSFVSNVNVDGDSDSSAHNENNAIVNDRVDRTPKIQAAKKAEMLKYQNDSDSEACSLYEYVTQNQKNKGNTGKEKPGQENKPNKSQDIVKKPRSAKKKPGRVVASRFMQSANPTALKNNTSSLNSTKDSNNASYRSHANVTKPKILTAKASLKATSRVNRLLDASKATHHTPPSLTSVTSSKNPGKRDRFTSTPTQDDSCNPYEIDASSIHPSNTMALAYKNDPDDTDIFQRNAGIDQKSKSADKITSLQQDIQYARYLQASYLSAQAKKSFKEQEKQAMDQLHGLWKLHEKKRDELCKSKMELQRLKTRLQIDTALDSTESQLNSLEEKLPQVGVYYTNLCSALNSTRHQIATKDIYIPNKTEEEREAYEDRLESALKESENLLKEITSKAGHAFPPLHQYAASLEAINGNVEESGRELRQGYKDLDVAHGLCSQLSSRMVIPML